MLTKTRPACIRKFATRELLANNQQYAMYGVYKNNPDGTQTPYYAERADDIVYFSSVADYNDYVQVLEYITHDVYHPISINSANIV